MDGFQHFGEVRIDGRSRELTVKLRDLDGAVLWATTHTPPRHF
jgi:alkaline phosphatase D